MSFDWIKYNRVARELESQAEALARRGWQHEAEQVQRKLARIKRRAANIPPQSAK